jgi:hypothetical protein
MGAAAAWMPGFGYFLRLVLLCTSELGLDQAVAQTLSIAARVAPDAILTINP